MSAVTLACSGQAYIFVQHRKKAPFEKNTWVVVTEMWKKRKKGKHYKKETIITD